jgi:hypothetical protein
LAAASRSSTGHGRSKDAFDFVRSHAATQHILLQRCLNFGAAVPSPLYGQKSNQTPGQDSQDSEIVFNLVRRELGKDVLHGSTLSSFFEVVGDHNAIRSSHSLILFQGWLGDKTGRSVVMIASAGLDPAILPR